MLVLSLREFQRHFNRYKDAIERVQVVGKGGVVIGEYIPALLMGDSHAVESQEPPIVRQEEASETMCEKCGKIEAYWFCNVENKDGEWGTKLCGVCRLKLGQVSCKKI